MLEEDIVKQQLYVCRDSGEMVSVFVLNRETDKEYASGAWAYPNASYAVVHRLCVNVDMQRRGVGLGTMKLIEGMVKEQGTACIRLDPFSQNPLAVNLYTKLGFKIVGAIQLRKGQFYLFEKRLIEE